MSDILEEMTNEMPHCFLRLNILLPADMAISSLHQCIAVKAVLFGPFV